MMFFHRSQHTAKIVLLMCVWAIFPPAADQFPVPGGFSVLLYSVSVPGPYGPHTLLMPVTSERNTHTHTPQANSSKVTSQSLSKLSNANSGFLQPEPGPAPDTATGPASGPGPAPDTATGPGPAPDTATGPAPGLHTLPSESSVLQMASLFPSNVPLQVYSFVQQAVMTDSESSEEGDSAQVLYIVPVRVDSPSMGVMESSVPNPDPGHLQIPLTTARPSALGTLGNSGKTAALRDHSL
ncbi:uncharacterized protein si:ch211-149b19.4 isoform X2 [Pseudorasbora parva]|uniref:uncharacterized protein si:ch211-149b19.4 isoform X2 n=1 Tax=Pseudorasbora parva TaxID=51549 RepID=UPI00351DFDB3